MNTHVFRFQRRIGVQGHYLTGEFGKKCRWEFTHGARGWRMGDFRKSQAAGGFLDRKSVV